MPYGERPPVTSGISTQRVSSAKSIHHTIPAFQVCIFWKDQSHVTIKTFERPRIMSHWQLYCLFSRAYRKNARMHQISTPLVPLRRIHRWPSESPQKGPAMRKALIVQFQNKRSIIDSSLSWKKKSTSVTSHEHQGISYHCQFYCLFNIPYTKT